MPPDRYRPDLPAEGYVGALSLKYHHAADGVQWRLDALHHKAWGKQWPKRSVTVIQSELGDGIDDWADEIEQATPTEDDDEDVVSITMDSERTYDCLEQIKSVQAACVGTFYRNDVLVIRDDFILLREAIEDAFKREQAVLVTGHPGIGKTSFLYYLLIYRLQHKLPTAIQFDSNAFTLLTADGAKRMDATVPTTLPHDCWGLVDSNVYVSFPCIPFDRTVLASCPRSDRWQGWVKQTEALILVTELPSTLEIAAVARANNMDVARAVELARRWGPDIRTIMVNLRRGPDEEGNAKLEAHAAARVACNAAPLGLSFPNCTASDILFLRPSRKLDARGRPVLSSRSLSVVPTRWLGDILDEHMRLHTHSQLEELVGVLSTHARTRSYSGWHFEQFMHSRFVGRGAGAALRISNLDGSESRELQSAVKLLCTSVNALRPLPDAKSMYWLPSTANLPGVDGVLIDSDNIYAFQATTAKEHTDPSRGLRKLWKHLEPGVRTQRDWHFVAVAEGGALARELAHRFAQDLEGIPLGARIRVRTWSSVLSRGAR